MEALSADSNSNHNLAKEEAKAQVLVVDDGGALKDSTDAELTKISLMRAFVESRDPSSKVPTQHHFNHHRTHVFVLQQQQFKKNQLATFFATTCVLSFPLSLFSKLVDERSWIWCLRTNE